MELRSQAKIKERLEFKELQSTLSGLGFYEVGMELLEMRQIIKALSASTMEDEPDTLERKECMGFTETDFEFLPMNQVKNSTMISSQAYEYSTGVTPQANKFIKKKCYNGNDSSPFSSPEEPSQQLTVQAEVYHANDWSPNPPAALNSPCISSSTCMQSLRRKRTLFSADIEYELNIIEIADAKKQCIETETSLGYSSCVSNDSGANMSHSAVPSLDDTFHFTDFSQDYNDGSDPDWLP